MPDAFGGVQNLNDTAKQMVVEAQSVKHRKLGTSTRYDWDSLLPLIFRQIAQGRTLSAICRDEGMPSPMGVYQAIDAKSDRQVEFARARASGFDHMAEECKDIADDSSNDYIESEKGSVFNTEHVQRSKLRIETRLKLLSKWDPKRYGEKSEVNLNAVVEQRLPLDQLQQEIQRLLSKSAIDVESIDNDSLT